MKPLASSHGTATNATCLMQGGVFEGLFVHALHAQGAFADGLRSVGFDPDHPLPAYPQSVFFAALEVTRRHVLPDLSAEHAYRELGRRFAEGYFSTAVGRVLAASLPLIGPDQAMARTPRYAALGREDISAQAHMLGERHWRIAFAGSPHELAPFTAGWVEVGLTRTGVVPRTEVVRCGPGQYDIDVRW